MTRDRHIFCKFKGKPTEKTNKQNKLENGFPNLWVSQHSSLKSCLSTLHFQITKTVAQSNSKVNYEKWHDAGKRSTNRTGISRPTVKCKLFFKKLSSCKVNKTLKIAIFIVLYIWNSHQYYKYTPNTKYWKLEYKLKNFHQ